MACFKPVEYSAGVALMQYRRVDLFDEDAPILGGLAGVRDLD
jgi:hypothetical protein